MTHARQQIREAIVAAIKNAVPEVSERVYPNRVKVLRDELLPAICVYTLDETQERQTQEHVMRSLDLVVECYVKENDGYDVALDDIAVGVEAAIKVVSDAGDVVQFINPVSHEVTLQGEAEKIVAVLRISAQASYITAFGVADVIT